MTDIFSLTAPLTVKTFTVDSHQGEQQVVAEYFKHPQGILYFDLYWHHQQPEKAMHIIKGKITGEGPWRIANKIFNVLGCRSTNIELAMQHEQWLTYLQTADCDYPAEGLVQAIARKMGGDIKCPF